MSKYRSQVINGKLKVNVAKILNKLYERKGLEIIEAECCSNYIYIVIVIPPKYSLLEVISYLKGKAY
jgi:putative transposase